MLRTRAFGSMGPRGSLGHLPCVTPILAIKRSAANECRHGIRCRGAPPLRPIPTTPALACWVFTVTRACFCKSHGQTVHY
eukprot:762023-Prorocentrum_minimum.AAC.4